MSTLKTNTIQAATGSIVSVAAGHTFAPAGHVIQTKSFVLTSTTSSTSTSFVDTGLELAITPSSTTSKIFLPAKDVEYFKVSPGEKVAVILASGTGNLHVSQLSE